MYTSLRRGYTFDILWLGRRHILPEHPSGATQRFVPDCLKLRTARFEHAHGRFAELSHIDHAIKLCPLFVDLGDRARSGVQKCSKTICTDIQWESSSHQHLQIRQLSGEVAAPCS